MKKLIVLLFLFSSTITFSQENDADKKYLHLVMTYRDHISVKYDYKYESVLQNYRKYGNYYYKILWRLENGSITAVDTLNAIPKVAMDLKQIIRFPSQKYFILSETFVNTKENYSKYTKNEDYPYMISILDYGEDSLIIRRINTGDSEDFKNWDYFVNGMYDIGNKIVLSTGNEWIGDDFVWYAVDKYFNRYDLSIDDLQNVIDYGQPSPFQDGYNVGFSSDKNGILHIGNLLRKEKIKLENKPKALLQVPEDMRTDSAYVNILINFPESNYLVTKPSCWENDCSTTTLNLKNQLWIQNKSTKEWEKLRLPFQWPAMSMYKNWLYGTKVSVTKGKGCRYYNDKKNRNARRNDFFRKNNTNEKRYSGKYGKKPPLFLGYTGELYLYHIPTKKQIHWNTGDLDSEFLMIEAGWIYYRIFDEIRRVPLDEDLLKVKWEKEELLIKDKDVIPNVHHIFWHKKSELYEKWLTPKPDFVD